MRKHQVVIAGGGPTGLMLAGELALALVDVAVVERRPNQDVIGVRAGGLLPRSLEVLDQRGIVERFVAEGQKHPAAGFASISLDLTDLPTRHNYMLALAQERIEYLLAGWVEELSVPFYRGQEVTGFTSDDEGVTVNLNETTLRTDCLVGCDGGRSMVRKQAGIGFPGWEASTSYLIAIAEMTETPPYGMKRDAKGTYAIGPIPGGNQVRLVLREDEVHSGEPSLDELRAGLKGLYGSDFGIHSVAWKSRFSDMARQADRYRQGRILLAGDAAHVHSPVGGQGLNTGVQDAVNLGWKLARVVHGTSPDTLLDTYHAERHPVAARVLRNTLAQTALSRADDRTQCLNDNVTELLALTEPRQRYASMQAGLDIRYDLGEGHPLLGRRVPDLELDSGRLSSLLHQGCPVLLNLGTPGGLPALDWLVEAQSVGPWEVPGLGPVPAPSALLIRPDGYVAWVGDGTAAGLAPALTRWFGVPADGTDPQL